MLVFMSRRRAQWLVHNNRWWVFAAALALAWAELSASATVRGTVAIPACHEKPTCGVATYAGRILEDSNEQAASPNTRARFSTLR